MHWHKCILMRYCIVSGLSTWDCFVVPVFHSTREILSPGLESKVRVKNKIYAFCQSADLEVEVWRIVRECLRDFNFSKMDIVSIIVWNFILKLTYFFNKKHYCINFNINNYLDKALHKNLFSWAVFLRPLRPTKTWRSTSLRSLSLFKEFGI